MVGREEAMKRSKKKKLRANQAHVTPCECPNCGEQGPHYVPPSLGEKGFFVCERKEAP